MPRPVQLTSPLPRILIAGFGGAANVNILPTLPFVGTENPYTLNPPASGKSNIVPLSSPVIIGKSLRNNVNIVNNTPVNTPIESGPVVFNRNLIIRSIADLSAETITLIGRDASHQPLTETLVGPIAAGSVTSVKEYAYLDSFKSSIATDEDNFDLEMGLALTTCPIRLDYFYPNTSYAVSGQVFGTGVIYTVNATIQKVTLFDSTGHAYTNPNIIWKPLDATLTNATTDVVYNTTSMRSAVYLAATLDDDTSSISFTLVQQGVK